ncbi:MAG: beta-galactosidase [Armatimonadetes bacterium]|nr:beta-galactosidase [Armatimonadota bacterium]
MIRLSIALIVAAGVVSTAYCADRSEYGGYKGVTSKATGFFRVEQTSGRWWCFDPTGAAFYAVGTDHCNYNVHWCESLGYAPYARNVREKFSDDESAWAKSATDRLKQWGFNALGANNSPSTRGRGLAYMGFLGMGSEYAGKDSIVPKVHWTGYPNVFNPAFLKHCEEKAQKECAPSKDDPWLFGWFIDNELEWFGKDGSDTGVATEAIKCPAANEGKKALVGVLKKKYPTIEKLNAAWGTSLNSWDDALASVEWKEQANEAVIADKIEFLRLCAEKYFSITTAAIRKADPNHMILGCRFAGNAPPVWDIAGKYCDIVSFNIYGQVDLDKLVPIGLEETLSKWHGECKRPMMVTEWSFPALDAGLPSVHGAGMRVRTQADKAKCFEVYQKTFFALPFMVGSDYFMWVDEPALGIHPNFPEDSNYGLVDVNDDVWEIFTEAVARVNPLAYDIHSGKTADVGIRTIDASDDGKRLALQVANSGALPARTLLRVTVDDKKYTRVIRLGPGASLDVGLRVSLAPGAHYVRAEADPGGRLVEVNLGDNKFSRFVHVPPPAGQFPGVGIAEIGVYSIDARIADPEEKQMRVVSVPLSALVAVMPVPVKPRGLRVVYGDGKTVQAEILDLDRSGDVTAADQLVFAAQTWLGACITYRVELCDPEDRDAARLIEAQSMDSVGRGSGDLRMTVSRWNPRLVDSIRLGDTEIGSLDAMIQQSAGGTWWQRPNASEEVRSWTGSLCQRWEVTLSNDVPKDAVSGPFGYQTTYAIESQPGSQWFTAQFLSLKNTDSRPWKLGSYFYHPNSAIGGSSDGDEPDPPGISGTAAWTDNEVGASYGIVGRPSSGLEVYFWKDADGNEHSDARVKVGKMLRPGETYEKPGVPVYLFCARTKDHPQPWLAMEDEINSLPKWEVFGTTAGR